MWDLLVAAVMWMHPENRRQALRAEIRDLASKNYHLEVSARGLRAKADRDLANLTQKNRDLAQQVAAQRDACILLSEVRHPFSALTVFGLMSALPLLDDGRLNTEAFIAETFEAAAKDMDAQVNPR